MKRTFKVAGPVLQELQKLAIANGTDLAIELQSAIRDRAFIASKVNAGYEILIRDTNGGLTKVDWT